MKTRIIILVSSLILFISQAADAQNISVGTNFMDWANFGTINIEVGMGVSQHVSIIAGGHYNPWEFKTSKGYRLHNQQATAYAGIRYWPWHVFSGWWIGGKLQYSDFSRTGVWRPALQEGKSIGAGISFGYTFMISKNLNLEFGGGIWGGRHLKYTVYECPECMRVRESGARNFIYPDEVSVSLIYVF